MSNPNISGLEKKEVTFKCASKVKVGNAVTLLSKDEVTVPGATYNFFGICTCVRDGYASIQIKGPVSVKYSGIKPSLGYNRFVTDDFGGIVTDKTTGMPYLVTDVDMSTSTCEILL